MRYIHNIISRGLLILIAAALFSAYSQAEQTNWDELNSRFAEFAQSYYSTLTKRLGKQIAEEQDIKVLHRSIKQLQEQGRDDIAIASAIKNKQLIADNLDQKEGLALLNLILENNLKPVADYIIEDALTFGDPFTNATVNYNLGLHYFQNNQVTKAQQHFSAIEAKEALTQKQQDYATLIFGVSLQQNKQHRQAAKLYQQLDKKSYYYGYAKLNEAVGYIRQGWWTDAQIVINQALESDMPDELKELSNRLLLVMGYSQLQNEFYRNARQTFRKISLDSQYVARALLGLGLCALNQKDYSGAMNLFTRLQELGTNELPVLETYVLIPLTFERMNDLESASALYTEAIAFFEKAQLQQQKELRDLSAFGAANLAPETLASVPQGADANFLWLQSKDVSASNKTLQKEHAALLNAYDQAITEYIRHSKQETIDFVQSYQSQSQYGLAKLYDDNQ